MRLPRLGTSVTFRELTDEQKIIEEARSHRWTCLLDEAKTWSKDHTELTKQHVRFIGFMDNTLADPIIEEFTEGKWNRISRNRIFICSSWCHSANYYLQGINHECPEFDAYITGPVEIQQTKETNFTILRNLWQKSGFSN